MSRSVVSRHQSPHSKIMALNKLLSNTYCFVQSLKAIFSIVDEPRVRIQSEHFYIIFHFVKHVLVGSVYPSIALQKEVLTDFSSRVMGVTKCCGVTVEGDKRGQ